jgi:beta-ureidopropionase
LSTVAALSEYLWRLEQPAHAVANQYFLGAVNRPGFEDPWRIGEFFGQSYVCDPRGYLMAEGSRCSDDIVLTDMDLDEIREVRNTWRFFRDGRPETYGPIIDPKWSIQSGRSKVVDPKWSIDYH